ncbi:hypothetical protein EST92_12820 [Streptomyces sp. TM32]|uniref:hypothetical protein n=1 Tax=Streptomyces sp. TM32 TaxID=1652669 RepID=UPI001011E477|nr:hypothetical protein [Streptomyces sp. TM32]RXS83814.1 hypothetical protein EST92_12820 [Streptomyces sp. TM32]
MGLIDGKGYGLDPEAIEQLTKGIRAATAELKELGFDIEAQLGRGFDRLSLDGMECGDDGLAAALDSFCDRWGWGVRTLMQDANEFAKKLHLTAGNYYEQEQYASDALKQTVNAAMGDPTKSAEQLHRTSWSDIGGDNPLTQIKNADYDPMSAESMKSHHQLAEAAQQFGHDVTSVPDRMTHGGDDPADVKVTFRDPRSQGQEGNDK